MLKLYINKDLKQLDINSNIKIKSKHDTKSMLETTQEKVETKTAPKSRGQPKDSKNKVYIPNPKFNRKT